MTETSGFIEFVLHGEAVKTWYRVVGDLSSNARPLVLLHGGPGTPNPYLDIHTELYTSYGIPLVFYDQTGSGKSTHLPDKPEEFWTVDLFMDELDALLHHLGIFTKKWDLYGHSWGGMLAADYAATRRPENLERLVITGSTPSLELWVKSTTGLLERYPEEFREMLRRHEREETTDSEEYQAGMQSFYQKHICTLDPWPQPLLDAFAAMEKDMTVYHTMFGTSEFNISGTLRTWSVIDKLSVIEYPTLVMNGLQDEAQDVGVYPFFEHIPKVKWVRFDESSHMPFYEEKERYFAVLGAFLKKE